MLIDTHVHAFPKHIAPKAIEKLKNAAQTPNHTDGTIADLRLKLSQWGVSLGVLLNIATTVHQQSSVNNFAVRHNHGNLISFGSVHPKAPNRCEEILRIYQLGLKGVKFHPDHQHFCPDDPGMYPVYELCQSLQLPVVFHTGFDPMSPFFIHATPERMAKIAKDFPRLPIICAHLGGYMLDAYQKNPLLQADNLFFDTAYATFLKDVKKLDELIGFLGPQRILFGSDAPWAPADKVQQMVCQTSLSDSQKEYIFYKNARQLLKIHLP